MRRLLLHHHRPRLSRLTVLDYLMRAGTHRSTYKSCSGSYDKATKEEVIGVIEEWRVRSFSECYSSLTEAMNQHSLSVDCVFLMFPSD